MQETSRRNLIFFVTADPSEDPKPARSAYHFADVASKAGLEAEVRLAGDAVRLAQGAIADTPMGVELREKVRSGADGPFLVSL